MEQSPSSEADSHSASQVHYRVHNHKHQSPPFGHDSESVQIVITHIHDPF